MNFLEPILLGMVQGLTEFIPVSSSGHLYVLPKIFEGSQFLSSTSFILFLHMGTLIALLVYYRNLIINYIKVSFRTLKNRKIAKEDKKDVSIIRYIIIGTIPAGIIGLVVDNILTTFYDEKVIDKSVAFLLVAIPMIIMGLLFIFEKRIIKGNTKKVEELGDKNSVLVGISQALAFIRGVSRSGITLLTGQLAGLDRYSAAEYSFFISIPLITASSIFEVFQFIRHASDFSNDLIIAYILGALSAFIFGYMAIGFLLKYLKTKSLAIFGYYRIYFGIFLIFLIIFR